MNAQLEEQDTEVQDLAAEIGSILQSAFNTLIERRDRRYEAAIEPLDAERDTLEQESASIKEARADLERLAPAKAREAQRAADVLLLAGKDEEAERKFAEAAAAADAPKALEERRRQISVRIEAIDGEKQAAARRIFRTWHEDCKTIIRPIEHGLFVVILDGVQQSFFDFQTLTNTGGDGVLNTLFRLGDITDLTAGERSPEWVSGSRWYGGRR